MIKEDMPIITIIIPIYNVERYIGQCLQSVANQTMTEGVACILVDDCGTDKSVQIAEEFVNNYNGSITFQLIHHQQNSGLSAARNTGIKAANGEYVYFLDSDDQITPDCMAGFMKIIKEHPVVDLIQGLIDQDSPYMNQFSTKALPTYTEDKKYIKKALLDYDELPVCAANKMVRRQLIVDNNLFFKEGIIHEDNYWSYFLAKYVKSLAVYSKKCYLYTENLVSITKAVNREKEIKSSKVIIEDLCSHIDSFLKGEQKANILRFLNGVLNNRYYESEEEKDILFKCLYAKCNAIERFLLRRWFATNNKKFKNTEFNLSIRLFKTLI